MNTNHCREHIYRNHIPKGYFCKRCFEEFKDDQSLQQHRALLQCTERKNSPYITLGQKSQIKAAAAKLRGKSDEEKWTQMLRILSPADKRILSPCECYRLSLALIAN